TAKSQIIRHAQDITLGDAYFLQRSIVPTSPTVLIGVVMDFVALRIVKLTAFDGC
ncbi:unnamed protein product, partial [Allacma fusca]